MNLGTAVDALLPDPPLDADDYTKELNRRIRELFVDYAGRINSVIPYSATNGQTLIVDTTAQGNVNWGAGGTGTVTNIATTAPITGGPITTTGTIAISDFVASGASHARGAVPDPGAAAGTTKFLREDATWAVPPGTGGASSFDWGKSMIVALARWGY